MDDRQWPGHMERILEPELMDDPQQAAAYAGADFHEPHQRFIDLLRLRLGDERIIGPVLDLGCGAADISLRLARQFPALKIIGLDGSAAMLQHARQAIDAAGLADHIELEQAMLPISEPRRRFAGIISNSLLHHLHDPDVFWRSILQLSEPGAWLFIMDLLRPPTIVTARQMVDKYAANEPQILQRDFFHSLCAAFTIDEIRQQLSAHDLRHLNIEIITDRHFIIFGHLA